VVAIGGGPREAQILLSSADHFLILNKLNVREQMTLNAFAVLLPGDSISAVVVLIQNLSG
jgi:hypothetical protein